VRDGRLEVGCTLPNLEKMFRPKEQVDPVRAPDRKRDGAAAAIPKGRRLERGATIYKPTVKDVPVDGFWSISIYNA
jgi:hypothetical protein